MTINIAIYAQNPQIISEEKLKTLAPQANISYKPTTITITWDTVDMTVNVMPAQVINQHLSGLLGFVQQMGATKDVFDKLSLTKQVLGMVIEGGVDDHSRLKKLILGIVSEYDGYFFAANAFYDADNRFIVGMSNAPKQFFPPDLPDETDLSLARKNRSIEILKSRKIPVIEHLPVIEDKNQVKLRSEEEVLYRAICLAIAATHGSSPDITIAKDFIEKYQLEEHLTPTESFFLKQAQPDQNLKVNISWHYEACYTLLWALGFVNTLGEPTDVCDVQALIDIIQFKSLDELMTEAKLRDIPEILDQADLIYRYSWASMNARYQGQQPPQGLHPSVVYERHYAFNWLRHYGDADWDNISTDT